MEISTISLKVLILDAYVDVIAQYRAQKRYKIVSGRENWATRFIALIVVVI